MKLLKFIMLLLILNSCSISKNANTGILHEGNLAFTEMIKLIGQTEIDTNKFKAVKIYTFEFKKNGKIKDSTLIEHQNLNYYSTLKDHTNYEVKYDSLGRDFERYATRIETGETHLNYRKIYDSESKITEWITYTRDGKVNSKTFYYYDNLERLVKSEKYDGYYLKDKPILDRRKIFEYNLQNIVKETEFSSISSSDDFDTKLIKEYNDEGQQIDYRSETIHNDSIVRFWGFKSYYNKKLLVKKQSYDSKNRNIITVYKYNSENLPIKIYSFDITLNEPRKLIKYYYLENRKTTHNTVYN